MRIITVDNPYFALAEQHRLTSQIFLKGGVLACRNMIWLQIGKNPIVKHKPLCPVHLKALWGGFHYHHITASFLHFLKIPLQYQRLRRCICCWYYFLSYNCFNGSNQPYLMSCLFQNIFYKVCRCCLSLCACYPDNFHALRRIPVKVCCNKRHCIARIFHLNHSYLWFSRKFYFFADY